MICWLRAKLYRRRAPIDPEIVRRTRADRERESAELWKLRTPPIPQPPPPPSGL